MRLQIAGSRVQLTVGSIFCSTIGAITFSLTSKQTWILSPDATLWHCHVISCVGERCEGCAHVFHEGTKLLLILLYISCERTAMDSGMDKGVDQGRASA
jgi:hypothetical protein